LCSVALLFGCASEPQATVPDHLVELSATEGTLAGGAAWLPGSGTPGAGAGVDPTSIKTDW
jgi:hypothetical protein